MGLIIKGLRKFGDVRNMLIILLVLMVLLAYNACQNPHIVLCKHVQFIVCHLYFSKTVTERDKGRPLSRLR